MWKNRGSVTMTAVMVMLVFAIYSIALYGRSVSIFLRQESEVEEIQEAYSKDVSRMYDIADSLK